MCVYVYMLMSGCGVAASVCLFECLYDVWMCAYLWVRVYVFVLPVLCLVVVVCSPHVISSIANTLCSPRPQNQTPQTMSCLSQEGKNNKKK